MTTNPYTDIIEKIYSKRKEINCLKDRVQKNAVFSNIFSDDLDFKDKFYNYFGISGASLMIADALKKKIILLQKEFDDANNLPKLEMPVYKNLDASHKTVTEINNLSNEDYNFLVNRIFQIQRKSDEFWGDSNVPIYTNVPEFDLKEGDNNGSFNSLYITRLDLVTYFLIWRFLIWKLCGNKHIREADLLDRDLISTKNQRRELYFEEKNVKAIFKNHKHLPEVSIDDLYEDENGILWKGRAHLKEIWQDLVKSIDSTNKSFIDEIEIVNDLIPKDLLDELYKSYGLSTSFDKNGVSNELFHSILKRFLGAIDSQKHQCIQELLNELHKKVPVLIPYFYFSIIDRRIKSHFAFSIWKSPDLAFEYYDKDNNLKRESSIFNCVVSLNTDINHTKQLELRTAIKLLTENIINEVIINQSIRAELRNDRHQFERTVMLSTIGDNKGLFVLGINEERITFVAQQSRALNLIRSLNELDIINEKKTLAIIGGGVSGITAAVAANVSGIKKVTIFEKASDILSFQSDAHHREIHPNIYDWPNALYDHTETSFPFLNWQANSAPEVLKQIRDKFRSVKNSTGCTINIEPSTEITKIEPVDSGYKIQSEDKSFGIYDIVLLAIGHGEERIINGLNDNQHSTYWQNDNLDTMPANDNIQILVSGSGDGALIDIIRSKLKMSHQDIFKLTNKSEFRMLGFEMLKVDRGFIRDLYVDNTSVGLYERYCNIKNINEYVKKCKDSLIPFLKTNVFVHHITRTQRFKLQTSLLNRMFVMLLHLDDDIGVSFKSYPRISKCDSINLDGEYRYRLYSADDSFIAEYDKVFFRHGTDIIKHYQHFDFISSDNLTNISDTFRLNLTNHVTRDTSKWYEDCIYDKQLDFLYDDIK